MWVGDTWREIQASDVRVYPWAELVGSMLLHCKQLSKARSSESYWVLIQAGGTSTSVYAVGAIEYFFMVDKVGYSSIFAMVCSVYSCTIHQTAGKHMYRVQHRRYHECGREDLGGRAVLPLSKAIGKLHRFVDTNLYADV